MSTQEHRRRQVVAGAEAPPLQAPAPARPLHRALRVRRDRGAGDVLLGDLVALERAHRLAAREHDDPVAQPLQLDDVGGDDDHRLAGLGGAAQHLVELEAGVGVDAARRLVGQQHRRVREQRAREQHLLLVAARERRDGRLHAGRAHVELLDLAGHQLGLAPALDDARARDVPEREQRDVLADAQRQQHALGVAVARQVHDAGALHAARVAQGHALPRQRGRPARAAGVPRARAGTRAARCPRRRRARRSRRAGRRGRLRGSAARRGRARSAAARCRPRARPWAEMPDRRSAR